MVQNSSNLGKYGRVVTFLVLTFGLSTIFYVKIIQGGEGIDAWVLPLMLCPGVSAIITKLVFDRNLKGLGWKPGPAKWLGLAYVLPILYSMVIYGITWLTGQGGFATDVVAEVSKELGLADASMWQLVAVYTLVVSTIVFVKAMPGAFGEELGWSGFLFPELQRMGSFTSASLIGGILWALFHLPLILFADYRSTAPIMFQVVVFFISTTALRFVTNWFRAKSGSVWPTVIFHASHNAIFLNLFDPLMARYPLTDFFVTEFGAGLMVISVLMALYIWAHSRELDPKPEATMTVTAKQPTAAD
jgi:membrane protease YdiL (CAAX protease family)